MTMRRLPLLAALLLAAVPAFAIDTALTYQGSLEDAQAPANGPYDFEFALYDSPSGGLQISAIQSAGDIAVVNGVFTTELDFGALAFTGPARYLEVKVRAGASAGTYTLLGPRSRITASPYAQLAEMSGFAASVADNSVGAAQIASGAVGVSEIDSGAVQRRVASTCAVGSAIASIAADGSVSCQVGPTGATGPAGPAGPTGPQGDLGPAGAQGPAGSADAWGRLGNAGTVAGVNFLGTTDGQSLVLRTHNVPSLRLEPSSILVSGAPITANVIAGSQSNSATVGVRGATISGGGLLPGDSDPDVINEAPNVVTDSYGTIGGGMGNRAGDSAGSTVDRAYATVSGGQGNIASGAFSFVGGGFSNLADAAEAVVVGGNNSTASGARSFVGGGITNLAAGANSVVTGGNDNQATGSATVVAGGGTNVASSSFSSVGGGQGNAASGSWSVVAGGSSNVASGSASAVSGGAGNVASNFRSTVDGGINNTASGQNATVGAGGANCAGGNNAWVGGTRGKVRPGSASGAAGTGCAGAPVAPAVNGDSGTFLWADSQGIDVVSTGPNQFIVRAQGGIWLGGNSAVSLPADRFINTSTGAYLSSGGTWTNASSRTLKSGFAAVDVDSVLARVLALPLQTWNYNAAPQDGRHLGPIAEDFHAAFGLGSSDRAISTVDADGVALAAIQGLNAKLEAENAELRQRLDGETASLKGRLAALERLLGTNGPIRAP